MTIYFIVVGNGYMYTACTDGHIIKGRKSEQLPNISETAYLYKDNRNKQGKSNLFNAIPPLSKNGFLRIITISV